VCGLYTQSVPFKIQPQKIAYYGTKMKLQSSPPVCNTFPKLPVTLESRSELLPGRCSRQLRIRRPSANTVYGYQSVFILEHNFASKSFAAIREALNDVGPDSEVRNKTPQHTEW
jgi:hypothetical protein